MDFSLRVVGPEAAEMVLAADVFDGPAQPAATASFLGQPDAADPRNILVLAEMEGQIVGFVSGTVLDHPDKPRSLFLQELGVNEAAQRRGIARALIERLRAEGRARGCQSTWVLTEDENVAARATYRSGRGTETTGVVMYEWDESPVGWID